jgi:hypothetical protein
MGNFGKGVSSALEIVVGIGGSSKIGVSTSPNSSSVLPNLARDPVLGLRKE